MRPSIPSRILGSIIDMRDLKEHRINQIAHRYSAYWWAISIGAPFVSAIVFTLIVRSSELLPGEVAATRWLHEDTGGFVRDVAGVFDVALDNQFAPIIFLALIPFVWKVCGRYAMALFLVMGGLTVVIRSIEFASRPRPTEEFVWRDVFHGSSSYPSGHVIYAVLIFGMVAYLSNHFMRPSWRRSGLRVFLVTVIALMGVTRVIELDHWPADVIGSYLISIALLLAAIWLCPRLLPWLHKRVPMLASLVSGGSSQGNVADRF